MLAPVVGFTAALLAVVAAPASAAPRPIRHLDARWPVIASDGGRYLAYQVNGTGIRLYDPQARTTRDVATGTDCQLVGMAAAHVLVRCDDTRGVVVDASSGASSTLPLAANWLGIGRRWVVGESPAADHPPAFEFLNWHDSDTRHINDYGPFELDAKDPGVLPPRTLYRARVGGDVFTQTVSSFDPAHEAYLKLTHKGRRRVVAKRPGGWFASVSYSPGLATWADKGLAFAYDVAHHRRLRWDFRQLTTDYPSVVHTAHHVFITVPDASGVMLYRIRWRR